MGRIRIRARKSTHVQRVVLAHVDRVRVRLEPEEGELEGKIAIIRADSIPVGAKLLEDQTNIPLGTVEIAEIRDAGTIRISRTTETDDGSTEESRIISADEVPPPDWEIDEETYVDLKGPTYGRMIAIHQLAVASSVRSQSDRDLAKSWAQNTVVTLSALGVDTEGVQDLIINGLASIFADAIATLNTEPDPLAGEKLAEYIAEDVVGWSGIPDETGEAWFECPDGFEERRSAAKDLVMMNRWLLELLLQAHRKIGEKLRTDGTRRDEAVKN